jgi:hypothetical protein
MGDDQIAGAQLILVDGKDSLFDSVGHIFPPMCKKIPPGITPERLLFVDEILIVRVFYLASVMTSVIVRST